MKNKYKELACDLVNEDECEEDEDEEIIDKEEAETEYYEEKEDIKSGEG